MTKANQVTTIPTSPTGRPPVDPKCFTKAYQRQFHPRLFREQLKAELARRGWTTRDLAARAELPYSAVGNYIWHGGVPDATRLTRLAAAFGESYEEFTSSFRVEGTTR